jgi:hypothetical protein
VDSAPIAFRFLRPLALRPIALTLAIALAWCAASRAVADQDQAECTPAPVDPAKFFIADGRIGIDVSSPLKAGEVNELTLVLHGPPIDCVSIQETGFMGTPVSDNSHTVRIRRSSSGSQYVLFTPTQLGKVGVRIMGWFSDGGLARFESTVDSQPSDREPALLMMQVGGGPGQDIDMWRLDLSGPEWKSADRWFRLWSSAYYLDSKLPAVIDPSYLHFSVKQPQGDPVIELKDDGSMRPLRIGDALLETTFGSTKRETCIQVREDSSQGDNSRCGELRSPEPDAPLDTVWTHNPDGLASHISQFDHFFVSRITVAAPNQPVGLAQPLDIPIKVSIGKVRMIDVQQKMVGSDATILYSGRLPTSIRFGAPPPHVKPPDPLWSGQEKLVEDDETSKVVEIAPISDGEETISVAVEFEDGGFDERYFHIKTVPSDGGLESIELSLQGPTNVRPRITACLKYSQIGNCVFLETLKGLHIVVDTPSIVRIDPDGTIHELSAGAAKVTVSLGSLHQTLQFLVSEPLIR